MNQRNGTGKKVTAFFLAVYGTEDIQVRSKAFYLLIVNLVMASACFFFLPVCFLNLVEGMGPAFAVPIMFALAPYAAALFLLKKGKLGGAMWITSITIVGGATVGKLFLPVTPFEDVGTFGFILLAFLLGIQVLSNRFSIIAACSLIGFTGMIFRGFVQILPVTPPDGRAAFQGTLFVAFFFYGLAFIFILFIYRLNRKFVTYSVGLAEENRDKVLNLRKTFELADSSLETGSGLAASADGISKRLSEMHEKMTLITRSSSALRDDMVRVKDANGSIRSSQEAVRKTLQSHRTMVQETSSVIDTVTGSVDSVAGITDRRIQDLTELSSSVREGYRSLAEVKTAMSRLQNQASDIRNFLEMIQDISERTNILAINAAIESARAGEHGRGFAIVAGEVRGLSVSTKENVDKISGIVGQTIVQVETTGRLIDAADSIFRTINKKIETFSTAILDIRQTILGIQESAKSIGNATTNVEESSRELAAVSEELDAKLDGSEQSVASVERKAGESESLVAGLFGDLSDFAAEIESIRTVAERNMLQLESLRENIGRE